MRKLPLVLIISILLMLFIFSCEEDPSENEYSDGPYIEWLTTHTISYSYSSGVITGVNIYKKFNVIDKSGEVQIIVKNKNSSGKVIEKYEEVIFVEKGEQYRVKLVCDLGSSSSTCSIVYDSPSSDSFTLKITDYSLIIEAMSVY